jgi:hypothetical protein
MGVFKDSSNAVRLTAEMWEYQLVAQPDGELSEMLAEEKTQFAKSYGKNVEPETVSQIPIASFLLKEELEETLIRWVQNICNLQSGFTVTLNNFSGFPPHTVYLRVLDALPFQRLATALGIIDGFIQSNDCPPLKLSPRPYLAIAENLPGHIYEAAIKAYAQRSFHQSFRVDRLVLLKKDEYNRSRIVNTFTLPSPLT